MQCSKEYSITVEAGSCCLVDTTSIGVGADPQGMSYATTDDRVFVSLFVNDVGVINASTDTLVTTIIGVGTLTGPSVYAPVNNRVYIRDVGTGDALVINPTLMTHVATITPPVGVTLMNSFISYDETNNVMYVTGTTATDNVVVVVDPIGATMTILISRPIPAGPAFEAFGIRAAHSTVTNMIYVPLFADDGLGSVTLTVLVYNPAGVFQAQLNVPGVVTGTVLDEQCYASTDTGHVYLLSDRAVANTPGANVIDPNTGLSIGTMSVAGVTTMGFAPDCNSVNLLSGVGIFSQFDATTFVSICDTNLGTLAGLTAQMATASNGRVFAPAITTNTVHSLHPP